MVATMVPVGRDRVGVNPEHAEDAAVVAVVAKMDKPVTIAKTITCPTTHP
jgi:hypothetical protein